MTAEQARQLADFVINLYPDDAEKRPELSFRLGDFSGDGIPYLRTREYHKKAIVGSAYDQSVIDRDMIVAVGDSPKVIFDIAGEGRSELEKLWYITKNGETTTYTQKEY